MKIRNSVWLVLLLAILVSVVYRSTVSLKHRHPSIHEFNQHWACHPASNKIGYNYVDTPGAKMVRSKDQLIWGPTTWATLHTMAENYPRNPKQAHQEGCQQFLSGLPYMLPCGECGYHLRDFEAESESDHFQEICSGRQQLRKFFVDSHNQVNREQKYPKPEWTVHEAEERYSHTPAVILENEKWGSKKVL